VEKVKEATRALDPPTTSNILAMAAPSGGYGIYHHEEIEGILKTAYSGFLAAKWASESKESGSAWVVIHTGFWGCGAFGGNRELMTILQVLAADLAEVDLHFHAVDDAGAAMAEKAVAFYRRMRKHTDDVPRILGGLARQGYTWGRPDGT
jgi:hypothetical protein